jgi:hypothetical protein
MASGNDNEQTPSKPSGKKVSFSPPAVPNPPAAPLAPAKNDAPAKIDAPARIGKTSQTAQSGTTAATPKATVTVEALQAMIFGQGAAAFTLKRKINLAFKRGTPAVIIQRALQSGGTHCVFGEHCLNQACAMSVHEKDTTKGPLMGLDAKVAAAIKKNEEEKQLALQKQQQEVLKQQQVAAEKRQEQLEVAQMTAQFISQPQAQFFTQPQGSWTSPLQMRPPSQAASAPAVSQGQTSATVDIPPSASAALPASSAPPAAVANMAMWDQFQQFQRFLAFSQSMKC